MSHRHVKIYYGPCESFHTVSHKPQKLRGLKDRLQKLGYRVDLAPVEFENYCLLEMCGHEIFRCNIQNLSFNTPWQLDNVCQRAIEAVLESSYKFKRARCYLWFFTLLEEAMQERNEFGPKDCFPRALDFDHLEQTEVLEHSQRSKHLVRPKHSDNSVNHELSINSENYTHSEHSAHSENSTHPEHSVHSDPLEHSVDSD